jgi:outer membrane protein assembly factor BamB
MKPTSCLLSLLAVVLVQAAFAADSQSSWPQWRGPLANGVAPQANPPLQWSETNNIKWKVKIPGSGSATPVVWDDRVFILSAIPTGKKIETPNPPAATPTAGVTNAPAQGGQAQRGGGGSEKPSEVHQFVVICLDRKTGNTLWQKVAREEVPHEGHQPDNTYASASPLTDGKLVFAYFGSRGLHCYDFDGNLKWSKDFGHMQTKMGFGEGASPALYGDTIVVYWDDETDNDFIVALDKHTGKELWRKPRNEATGWSTPLIVEYKGKPQVIVNAKGRVRSYDLATGDEIWQCGGQTDNPIPSPVADADTVYVISGFRGAAAYAIGLGHTGDLTGNTNAIRWSYNKNMPYVPSPLLAGDFLYAVKDNAGILSCFDAKTGKPYFEAERLEGIRGIYASPVSAKDRVYILGREGKCVVLKKGPRLEILATNSLDDKTDASIALAGNELFIRGRENLYCITGK